MDPIIALSCYREVNSWVDNLSESTLYKISVVDGFSCYSVQKKGEL